MVDNVIKLAEQSLKDKSKADRSKEVSKLKMPGYNPAMGEMSIFAATLWQEIMVNNLGRALQKKLRDYADEHK